MPQDKLEQTLLSKLQGPPRIKGQLPDKPDMLSEVERLLGVAIGTGEQQPGSLPDAVAAMSGMLPIGKLLSLLKRGKKAIPAATKFVAPEPKVKINMPEQPMNKAELPAEMQAVGDEQTYNELRAMREKMREPKLSGLEQQVAKRTNVEDPIRAAREKNAAEGKPSKVKPPDKVPAVRGSVLEDVPETFDDYLRQDVEYLRENIPYRHTSPTRRSGEGFFEANDKQQTFAGLDENGEPTNEAGLDFMRDFNEMQHLDQGRLDSLENIFQRHDRDHVTPTMRASRPTRQLYDALQLKNAGQAELPFGPGYPLISVDADVPFEAANDAAGAFRRSFEHLSEQDWPYKDTPLSPNDIARSVHFTNTDAGNFNPPKREVTIGVAERGDNIAAHEMRHAMDDFMNPSMLMDYPQIPENPYNNQLPPEYWTHPAEVRARSTGAIGELMGEAERTGQQHLPGDFLEEFGRGVSTLEGNLNADFKRLIDTTNPRGIRAHDMFRGPYQKLFDFMRDE